MIDSCGICISPSLMISKLKFPRAEHHVHCLDRTVGLTRGFTDHWSGWQITQRPVPWSSVGPQKVGWKNTNCLLKWTKYCSQMQLKLIWTHGADKVHIFWEGYKILRNLQCRFDRYYIGQIYSGDFAKNCGFLRIYEH